ncbi:hypothetical protein B0I22_2377 [Epilithonimonas xixisoli]|uniref:Uncharacterized protein n=1 Tax=Epilithonimonas xixisoli TaxID=1476462 RepID=A0A4R8I8F0_9FLAO|nr:hypothetical protein B0I22_2377 [Epilithonimonas xixisoli]
MLFLFKTEKNGDVWYNYSVSTDTALRNEMSNLNFNGILF